VFKSEPENADDFTRVAVAPPPVFPTASSGCLPSTSALSHSRVFYLLHKTAEILKLP